MISLSTPNPNATTFKCDLLGEINVTLTDVTNADPMSRFDTFYLKVDF